MVRKGDVVLVDTTLIIEAHNAGCLEAITSGFRMQTVEECVRETQDGSLSRAPDARIDETRLRSSLDAVHAVTDRERAKVVALGGPLLDEGERDLWAHALGREDAWVLSGPDRASMRFGYQANLRSRLVTLETMLRVVGHTPRTAIRDHYTDAWLEDVMTKCVLGIL